MGLSPASTSVCFTVLGVYLLIVLQKLQLSFLSLHVQELLCMTVFFGALHGGVAAPRLTAVVFLGLLMHGL